MTITLDGIVFDEADFAGAGYLDLVAVGGVSYPRWQGFLVAALRDAGKALVTSSTTSLAVGTGSKSLTTALDLPFQPGQFVLIADQAAPTTNWMHGQIASKSATSMTVIVAKTGGGGTKSAWYVSLSGPEGATGAPGSAPYGSTLPSALGSAATGSNSDAARIDHVHPAANLGTGAVTGTLPVANGGTGSTTTANARTALGATAVGGNVFTAADAAAARSALGSTAIGDAVFIAASVAAAQAAIGVGPDMPGVVDGRYYGPANLISSPSGPTVTANRLYAVPFRAGAAVTWNRIGINVTAQAGTLARLGIYQNSAGVPGALVADLGTVATDTTGAKELTISQSLNADIFYWLAAIFDGTPTVNGISAASSSNSSRPLLGSASVSDLNANINNGGVYRSQTFGALPDPFGGSLTLAVVPLIWMRKV